MKKFTLVFILPFLLIVSLSIFRSSVAVHVYTIKPCRGSLDDYCLKLFGQEHGIQHTADWLQGRFGVPSQMTNTTVREIRLCKFQEIEGYRNHEGYGLATAEDLILLGLQNYNKLRNEVDLNGEIVAMGNWKSSIDDAKSIQYPHLTLTEKQLVKMGFTWIYSNTWSPGTVFALARNKN